MHGKMVVFLTYTLYKIRRGTWRSSSMYDLFCGDDTADLVKLCGNYLKPQGHDHIVCSEAQFPECLYEFQRCTKERRKMTDEGQERWKGSLCLMQITKAPSASMAEDILRKTRLRGACTISKRCSLQCISDLSDFRSRNNLCLWNTMRSHHCSLSWLPTPSSETIFHNCHLTKTVFDTDWLTKCFERHPMLLPEQTSVEVMHYLVRKFCRRRGAWCWIPVLELAQEQKCACRSGNSRSSLDATRTLSVIKKWCHLISRCLGCRCWMRIQTSTEGKTLSRW